VAFIDCATGFALPGQALCEACQGSSACATLDVLLNVLQTPPVRVASAVLQTCMAAEAWAGSLRGIAWQHCRDVHAAANLDVLNYV
jgi:hypothetical protein